ncbi:hypothetical protein X975_25979, partial [Stegodyphus mimosarum]
MNECMLDGMINFLCNNCAECKSCPIDSPGNSEETKPINFDEKDDG